MGVNRSSLEKSKRLLTVVSEVTQNGFVLNLA